MILKRNGNSYELPELKQNRVQLCEIEVGEYFVDCNQIGLQLSEESENGCYRVLNLETNKVYDVDGGVYVEPLHCEVKLSRVLFYEGKESEDEH